MQILTQEDWNVVLFNGMEKTSHWAALYFVTLMTFGNYVLFNLLVAILVEGFSSEVDFRKKKFFGKKLSNETKTFYFQRHERREREQRELVKAKLNAEAAAQEQGSEIFDDPKSFSESTTSDSYNETKGKWFSAEELRKVVLNGVGDTKDMLIKHCCFRLEILSAIYKNNACYSQVTTI